MQQLSFLPGEMTPGERSLILRALKTLDRHLHEPCSGTLNLAT